MTSCGGSSGWSIGSRCGARRRRFIGRAARGGRALIRRCWSSWRWCWRGAGCRRCGQTLRVAGTDVSIRRFLGFGLTERLPDHSTFSHAQTKRFADSSVFEQLFTAVLRRCTEAGLVGGRRLLVDATHIEADAALKSLRAELSLVETESGDGDGDGETVDDDRAARPALTLAEPRSGPTPKRTASNATAVSRTDPDGKLRHKPGQRTHLVHRGQVAVDPKRRVIIAVEAERATGSEADALETLGPARPLRRPQRRRGRRRRRLRQPGRLRHARRARRDGVDPAAARRAPRRRRGRPRADAHGDRTRRGVRSPSPRRRRDRRAQAPRRRPRALPRHPAVAAPAARRGDRDQPQAPPEPPGRPRTHPNERSRPPVYARSAGS